MDPIINYMAEANAGLLLFMVAYLLLLKNEMSFGLKRFFLLAGIVASFTFPFFHIQLVHSPVPIIQQFIPSILLPETGVENRSPINPLLPTNVLSWIYLLGVGVCSVIFLIRLIKIVQAIVLAPITYRHNGFFVAEATDDRSAFSFFRFIFIGPANLSPEEKEHILAHERTHARLGHSFDVLLLHLTGIVFWFNPAVLWYKKTMTELHEFEADSFVVKNTDLNAYCGLLAKMTLQSAGYSVASYFGQPLTMKRIAMVQAFKKKTKTWKVTVAAVVFPLLFLIVACQDQWSNKKGFAEVEQRVNEDPAASTRIYTLVDEQPEYPGGLDQLRTFIASQIRYPDAARKSNTEGTVFISFVVNEDGLIQDIKILKGLNAECDQEALRAVKLMPPWIPGKLKGQLVKVRMVVPIRFKLQ